MEGHGGPRAKNGPALAGHGAEAVRDAVAASITTCETKEADTPSRLAAGVPIAELFRPEDEVAFPVIGH